MAQLRLQMVPYLQQGWSISQLAALFGKSETTIKKWKQHPDVRKALGDIADAVVEATTEGAKESAALAWETLRDVMKHGADERCRVEAAKTVLDRTGYPATTKTEGTHEHRGDAGVRIVLARDDAARLAKEGE